jgi:NAD(P)-dependent dehydrogenase (short-subunit alcohol dehydrogenase family)
VRPSVDAFSYDGKRALVVGGATGMGAATASLVRSLGAHVTVFDIAEVSVEVDDSMRVDLRSIDSVDKAVDALDEPIDALFSCAGVADGTAGILEVNFVAQRHIMERMVSERLLADGGAIGVISSLAGTGWHMNTPEVLEFLATPDWQSALDWVSDQEITPTYRFTKRAMSAYIAMQAMPLLQRGIRINGIEPSMTDTPLARANADRWFRFGAEYRTATGLKVLTPEQMAYPLAFLCSDAASGVSGTCLIVDQGLVGAALTDTFDTPGTKARFGL